MIKYELDDIVLKTPGMQLKEIILDKYGSLSAFAEEINLYESSIVQYLSQKQLGSTTFKIRLTQALDKDYHELYKTEVEQIREFTYWVSWYYYLYKKKSDILILDRLKEMTLSHGMLEEYAVVCRCYAYYFYFQDKKDRAYAQIDIAVNTMKGIDNIDRFGLYLSDMVMMKAEELDSATFKKVKDEINQVLKNVKGPLTRGHINYSLALNYLDMGKYEKSEVLLLKVLEYHKEKESRSIVYLKLGDIKKKQGFPDEALEYYQMAESMLGPTDDRNILIFIEYAKYYLKHGDKMKAEKYLDRIMKDTTWRISSSKNDYLRAYADVKIALNKEEDMLPLLSSVLEDVRTEFIFTLHHLKKFSTVIEKNQFSDNLLSEISDRVADFVIADKIDVEAEKLLKQILGSILIRQKRNQGA